ncbi:MAG: ATP-binding protein [Amphiplicatus sp.]
MKEFIGDPGFIEELTSTPSGRIVLEAISRQADGFAIFGPNFEPIYANEKSVARFPATYKTLAAGGTMPEAVRASVRAVMPNATEEEIEKAAEFCLESMRAGTPMDAKTQNDRYVQVTYKQISEGRRVAISSDITELRDREKELRHARRQAEAANEAKSAFLANTSHEIRTPLNAILGLAQALAKKPLPEDANDHVASILDAGKTLLALLDDVLNLSKIEAGKLDLAPVDVDLGHSMRRMLKMWGPQAEQKGLEISLSLAADLPALMHFDPTRVRQCVSNLVLNAIKFTEKGSVDISVRAAPQPNGDHLVTIRVADTGIGIEPEAAKTLFSPFVQADASTSRRFGGTGLGLAITRRLARLMGGDAEVESRPGEGSTFSISFVAGPPKNPAAAAPASDLKARGVPSSFKGLKALIVDDIPINRQVAALFLKPLGCIVAEAGNGVEALDKLAAEHFDLIVLDMHMPVMDGPETVRQVRASKEAWRDISIIALTADAMSGDRERYLALGMNGYLPKPISEPALISEMQRVLAPQRDGEDMQAGAAPAEAQGR